MQVQHQSQESFIHLLKHIIETIGVRQVLFSQLEPILREPVILMNKASFDIVLSGRKHMLYAAHGKVRDEFLEPGQIHFCPASHWKWPRWDSLHEMASLVYTPEYVRITYINYGNQDDYFDSHPADTFYHTATPLSVTGLSILHSLHLLADAGEKTGMPELVTALFKLTLQELETDSPRKISKARHSWMQIRQYVQENFTSPINREQTAACFRMNPSYISRLCRQQEGESFNNMLRQLRLEHAALLLKKTNMNIDEITVRCGYLSSTYFSTAFQQHYGLPPGKYRR